MVNINMLDKVRAVSCAGDPLDPLEGGAEEDGEHIEMEGVPDTAPVDESTNGFLDEVKLTFV